MPRKDVRVTGKGFVDLTGVRTQEHHWYLAEEDPDGTIHLVPAVLVPAKLRDPLAGLRDTLQGTADKKTIEESAEAWGY